MNQGDHGSVDRIPEMQGSESGGYGIKRISGSEAQKIRSGWVPKIRE